MVPMTFLKMNLTTPHISESVEPFWRYEKDKRSITTGELNEMKILTEALRKENCAKEREIRKLHKDVQHYEQTIMSLRSEMSLCKYHTPDGSKKDAEVMAGMCCTGAEGGDWAPVKDFNSLLREEMLSYQDRIQKMETNLKSSGEDVRALRKVNVGLREELHALRGVCAALGEQARAALLRGQFKDEIIREMRRQLKHAKAKSKEAAELSNVKSRVSQECEPPYERDNRSHAATCAGNNVEVRDGTTCTCNILKPVCTSTPNCSQRSLEECCPEMFIIEHTWPLENTKQGELEDQIVLQCSASGSTYSIHSEPNMIAQHEVQNKLNKTYELTSKTSCNKSKSSLSTKPCPTTVDLAKEWLSNKTSELKHKIEDLISQQNKSSESKHVDFRETCELRSKHGLEPSPCQSARSSHQPIQSCDRRSHISNRCNAGKTLNFIDIAGRLCELCKRVLGSVPYQAVIPCRHVDVADKVCEHCKHILDSTPCQSENSCKYCIVADKFCKHCKYILVSALSQPVSSFTYIDIAEKLYDICKHILEPAPDQPDNSRTDINVAGKLCKDCKPIMDSEPCLHGTPCKHCDTTSKLCNQCRHTLETNACKSDKPCKLVDIADKLCGLCKFALDPVLCSSEDSCKHCDITKKLCNGCKSILDSTPCHADKSCRNLKIADKLCDHCKHVIDSDSCQAIKTCKIIDVTDKFCDLCKHVVESAPHQTVKSSKRISDPCQSEKLDKSCDISKKLRKERKLIVDCQTDRSWRNVDTDGKLCKHCKLIYDSAGCQPIKSSLKHCEDSVQSHEPCKSGCTPCNPDNACKHCDINPKSNKDYKCSPEFAPRIERTSKNLDLANKLCEQCRHDCHIDPSHSNKSFTKNVENTNEADGQSTFVTCQHGNVSKKLCKKCKHIFDSVQNFDRSCKNIDILNKLCENCRFIYDTCPCHSVKSTKQDNADMSREDIFVTATDSACKCDQPCKCCDISKKICKKCKYIFDSVPCDDKIHKNIDIANKICERCRHIHVSATGHSRKSCMKHDIADKSCENGSLLTEPASCKSNLPWKHRDIRKILCKDCKSFYDSISSADISCKNLQFSNKLCETCRNIFVSTPYQLDESCTQDIVKESCKNNLVSFPSESKTPCTFFDTDNKACERCQHVPDSVLCQPLKVDKDIQVPEQGEGCKTFEELFFNDQAAGSSSADLWKCGKCACALESQSAATLTSLGPLIQQEAKSTCFDITKDKSRGSSPDSPGSSRASARALHYQNKLLATLQILQNKEETVRVQAESLAVAESRIAALNARHTDLRREIDRKEREIQGLRKDLKEYKKCRVDTCDASFMADIQETDDPKNVVTALQNDLDVIEELYRECFYESVKQDNLIEMFRKSFLDIRLMDKEKSDRISKLHNVINAQKWSLDRCQDIATEVESLKMEISNFINSSNNDSGMWEESVTGLNEDLQDIAAQLLTLRDMLTGNCSCGLEQENMKLRKERECLESEICSLRAQISALEANIQEKDSLLDKQCQEQIETKERELKSIREQLFAMMENTKEKADCCDNLTRQLEETKAMLDDKTRELCSTQNQCRAYEGTIQRMKEELSKSEEITKENETLRKELCCLSRRGARVQRRVLELEGELARAAGRCQRVEDACREKTSTALELERQLDEAHARGAELCGEAGRAVRAVRRWAAGMKDVHREQEKQIKQQECKLRFLQNELHKRQLDVCPRVWEQLERDCAARPTVSEPNTSARANRNETVTIGVGERRHDGTGSSGSEIAMCSSTPEPVWKAGAPSCSVNIPSCSANARSSSANETSCSADIPPCLPKRTCKKASACGLKLQRRYGWLGPFGAAPQRDAAAQHAARTDAGCLACTRLRPAAAADPLAPVSAGEEMLSRIESLSAALADGYRRWSRRAPT